MSPIGRVPRRLCYNRPLVVSPCRRRQRHPIDSAIRRAATGAVAGGPCRSRWRIALLPRRPQSRTLAAAGRASESSSSLVRPGPAFYFPGPDGAPTGFEHDLARRSRRSTKLPLRFALVDPRPQVIAAIATGEAHIGVGGLYRPLAATAAGRRRARPGAMRRCGAGRRPSAVDDARRHRRAGADLQPRRLQAVRTGTISKARRSRLSPTTGHSTHEIAAVRIAHPEIRWDAARAAFGRRR